MVFREFPTCCWKTSLQHCRPFLRREGPPHGAAFAFPCATFPAKALVWRAGHICCFWKASTVLKRRWGSHLGIHVCFQTAFCQPGTCTAQPGSRSRRCASAHPWTECVLDRERERGVPRFRVLVRVWGLGFRVYLAKPATRKPFPLRRAARASTSF